MAYITSCTRWQNESWVTIPPGEQRIQLGQTQPNHFTLTNTLLVAAFYDHRTNRIYMSTILRGRYLDKINAEKDTAPVWRHARQKKKAGDAEDGAYYYREVSGPPGRVGFNYGDTITGKPAGSMIVAWGVKNLKGPLEKADIGPVELCLQCQELSYRLGVDFDGANAARFGQTRPLPTGPRPQSAPPSQPGSRIPRPVTPNKSNQAGGRGEGKRRPSNSPEGSGQHKPAGPSSLPSRIPVAIPHRPSPGRGGGSKSPSRRSVLPLSRIPCRARSPGGGCLRVRVGNLYKPAFY
jgi:hypothetical protein